MKGKIKLGLVAAIATGIVGMAGIANAQSALPEGVTVIQADPPSKDFPLDKIYSGYYFRTPETQALNQDDFENPAFLWVEKGEALWSTVDGKAGKSCASCHNDAAKSMKGVRAAMPKWDDKLKRPLALEQRINNCRKENMQAKEWKWESDNMLSMTSFVALQSRGMPVSVQTDGPMQEWHDKGKDLYYTRVGQLAMSCAHCHENNYGKYIRADHLSQGQINGFPTYRMKWQKLGSIHRRFVGCMRNIRATPYKRGSDEFVALEIYLASRGKGLQIESPSTRN